MSLADRMDGGYQPPILIEPEGGPIPVQDSDGDPDDEDEVLAAGKRFDPGQRRDGDGKWTRTGGGATSDSAEAPTALEAPNALGDTAVGRPLKVRRALAKAKTVAEVEAVAAAEVRRLKGHDRSPIGWNFTSDNPHGEWERSAVTSAREHAEGILRVVEEFPRIAVRRVRVAHPFEDEDMGKSFAYARGGEIVFNLMYSSDNGRRTYLSSLKESGEAGWLSVDAPSPISIAIHEAGHVLDINTLGEAAHVDALVAYRKAAKDKASSPVSTYAATNAHELVAESFADVMVNGVKADPTSRRVFLAVAKAYDDAVQALDKAKREGRQ